MIGYKRGNPVGRRVSLLKDAANSSESTSWRRKPISWMMGCVDIELCALLIREMIVAKSPSIIKESRWRICQA